MKIAVTGASGHIGANLCPYLLDHGHSVIGLVNKSKVHDPRVKTISGSILDKEAVNGFIEGVDAVIHLAAKISLGKDKDGSIWDINANGTKNVVQACVKHGVKKLIHFGTIHAFNTYPTDVPLDEERNYIAEGTAYDLSKIAADTVAWEAQNHGIITNIIYPTSVVGPNDYGPSLLGGAIIDIYRGKVPFLVPGGYDYVDVRDVVWGTYQVLIHDFPGENFILGGQYLSIKELAKLIGNHAEKKISTSALPSGVLWSLLPFFQLQSWITQKSPLFTRQTLKSLLEGHKNVSSAKAERLLGYTKSTIEQTIEDTLNGFKESERYK